MVLYISEVDAYKEFIDGLKKAAGCAHALAQYQQKIQWYTVRDLLENIIENSQKIVTAKSTPRAELLDAMNQRLKESVSKVNG